MDLSLASRLRLSKLAVHEKRKHYIVEDTTSGEFYEMPFLCVEAIRLMEEGLTLKEIEERLQRQFPEEEVNLLDFSNQLLELDLVETVDGQPVQRNRSVKPTAQASVPSSFSSRVGKMLFSPVTLILYAGMLAIVAVLWLFQPELFPHYTDLFVSDWMVVNSIAWLVLSLIIVLIHESGHYFAVRSRGVTSRLGVGHRLFLVVFETEMSGVWRLPAKQRYVPYLGGICFDIALLFIATLARLLWGEALPLLDSLAALIGLCTLINLCYQFLFYMKTDLYYVMENASGVYNLMESSQSWLGRYFPFRSPKTKAAVIYEGEEAAVRRYAWFYLSGLLVSFLLLLMFLLPQTVYAIWLSLPKLAAPWNSPVFWDGIVFILELLLMLVLLGFSWWRKWKESSLLRASRLSSAQNRRFDS